MLGLPEKIDALLFDMDGVLTKTATVHAQAWKQAFDAFLRERAQQTGDQFVPFDVEADYDQYVDGKPREDGVRSFLAARDIKLPEGKAEDPPSARTVHGLGNDKNERMLALVHAHGVEPYPGSLHYVREAKHAGLRVAVVSSSTNTDEMLAAAGLAELFATVIDGHVAEREKLAGKPAPDTFLAAAHRLGAAPDHAAVFEDALSGVAAGHAGHFGYVVGVDRVGQREALLEHGADVVVSDLAELLTT